MTVRPPDDPGPPIDAECEVCGQPQQLHVQPFCPGCHALKPGDRVRACMERMLTRARTRA